MDEKWGSETVYDHCAAAPDDGFCQEMSSGMGWTSIKWQVLPDPFNRDGRNPTFAPADWWPSNCEGYFTRDCPGEYFIPPNPPRDAPSYVYDLWDTAYDLNSCSLKQHKIANLSLDKGGTVTMYARGLCFEGGGGWDGARSATEQANIYICDDYGTGKCMASFRYGRSEVGICTNASTWTTGSYTDNQQPDRPGQGWHLVRITGRNQVVGDPTTTQWKYYLDENSTPLITGTGSIGQSMAPGMSGPFVDCIAIGVGAGSWCGNWQCDWTAVNTDGDYAPGEWSGGGAFATISEARAANVSGPITITGNAVITAVVIDENCAQIGFSVQDVDTEDHAGMYIATSNSTNVAVGNTVTGLSGIVFQETGLGMVLSSAGFTASTVTAAALPLAMVQKSLHGVGHTAMPGTENGGTFVRTSGRLTAIMDTSTGGKAVYLDDGCGLIDGRSTDGNPTAKGLRILARNICLPPLVQVGKYYRADGICTCETWTEGAITKTVETLLGARFTEIPEP